MSEHTDNDLQALFQVGLRAHQAGQLPDAEAAYQRILATEPDHADANHLLGVIAHQVGDHGAAVELIGTAIRLDPSAAAYHCNMGNALYELGRLDEAAASQHQAIELKDDYANAHNNLGTVLLAQGNSTDAAASYRKALLINPDAAETLANLGNALLQQGDLYEAEANYRKALALNPSYTEAHTSLGNALKALGRLDDAVASHQRALALDPDYAEAHVNLGSALKDLGRRNKDMGKLDDAVGSYRKAIALAPDLAGAHTNLGLALLDQGRLKDAIASHQRALTLKPDYAEAHNNLGFVLNELGNPEGAVDCFRKSISIKPDFASAHSNLLVTMPLISDFDGAAVFAAARRTGAVFEQPFADRLTIRHANTPDPERQLRVGYLSPSLKAHVLAKNIEPILKAHRRDKVSIHVYAHVPKPDDVTWRLKELADSWTFVHGLSDDGVAALIRKDSIDILVDPMGHWVENRLLVFARKPAPIQVFYLSQGLTTGLSAMDYTIGDRWLNLDGAMQSFATEHVVELPSGFEVKVPDRDFPVGEPPSIANGFITFSSFNNPAKISNPSLRLWATVLAELPTARFLIKGKGLDQPEIHAFLSKRMIDHGIPADRTDFLGFVPGPDHLTVHNLADIALDTTPFAGGQTTIDALWMGVPMVTLIGDTACGRYGYSHLNRIGHPELAARSEAGFVQNATALARDPDRLRHYRQTLRPALCSSPIFDASLHVTELEDAFRVMWRRWCDGLEPKGFAGFDKSGP